MTITSTLDNPALLAPYFSGPSWATWRAILRAAEGLPLDEDQLRLFRAVAERDPPTRRVRELWVIAGRRSGKDSIASAIATVAAMGDYSGYLRPGERSTVMCLACDRDQARIVHRYIAGYFSRIPLLKPLVERETADGIELTNDVEIIIATNSFRAVRGRTIALAILDEAAFWRDETTSTPDVETYNAVEPGMVTIPGAMLIGISSPYRRGGLLYRKFAESYGKPDDDVLVVKGPSTTFNPTLPARIIDAALERDPDVAAAEWLGEFRNDISDFVSREVVEAAVVPGRYELPPVAGISYYGFVDVSGAGADSMTLAVAHRGSDGRGILDLVREVRPPFSPESVVAEFAELLHIYRVARIIGDRWGGEWPVEAFARHKIVYEQSARPKSDIYRDFLPLLNSGRLELLDHKRLVSQTCSLERRTARGGKDSIDHPAGLHDDVINAVAGALVAVTERPAISGAGVVEFWRRAAGTAALGRDEEQAREREAAKDICPFAKGSIEWAKWHVDRAAKKREDKDD